MNIKRKITNYLPRHYKTATVILVVLTSGLGALIALIKIDTDPKNMLSADESAMVFGNQTREQFALSEHFEGNNTAYLVLDSAEDKAHLYEYIDDLRRRLIKKGRELKNQVPGYMDVVCDMEKTLLEWASTVETKKDLVSGLSDFAGEKAQSAYGRYAKLWYEFAEFFEQEKERIKLFKQPYQSKYLDTAGKPRQ